jgi:hypothetical protein
MLQLYPNQGLVPIMQRVVVAGLVWRIFTNAITPDQTTVLADLIEAAFAGYAPVTVPWVAFGLNGVSANAGYAIAAPIGFTNSSGADQTIQGYYVTDAGNTILFAVAAFDDAPEDLPDGATKVVVPVLGDFSSLTP